jgi:hypothetical protein
MKEYSEETGNPGVAAIIKLNHRSKPFIDQANDLSPNG